MAIVTVPYVQVQWLNGFTIYQEKKNLQVCTSCVYNCSDKAHSPVFLHIKKYVKIRMKKK